MIIRRARVVDYPAVWALLTDSVRWLRGKNTDQWGQIGHWPDKVAGSLVRGDVWLVYCGGDPVATVTVETSADPAFWTAGERAQPAVYLSKLAVRRDLAGRGIGADILRWATDRAYRTGARWVRLDAWKTNTALHDYYRSQGWTYLRTAAAPRRRSGALFQLAARPTPSPIEEVPAMTVLPTGRIAGPEGGDPAGNQHPGHLHIGSVVVKMAHGPEPVAFNPDYRYRLQQHRGGPWILDDQPAGAAWWEPYGRVVSMGFPLPPGRVYVISHAGSGSACRMVIEAVPVTVNAGGRLPVETPAPADAA